MRSVLPRLTTLGGLLGIKTAPLIQRLAPLADALRDTIHVTIPHGFDAVTVTARASRELARTMCPWLDALVGDELDLAIDATSITAWSDEAALPTDAPSPLPLHAARVELVGFDGHVWTYTFEGTRELPALMDELAVLAGVTDPQRRIAAELHRSLERDVRVSVRARDGALDPAVLVAWDRVEWAPIQSMLRGFYPRGGGVDKIARLARAIDADSATVELILGPTDPPGLTFSFDA